MSEFKLVPDTRPVAERDARGDATGEYREVVTLRPAPDGIDAQRLFDETVAAITTHISMGRFGYAIEGIRTLAYWFKAASNPRTLRLFRREFDELVKSMVRIGAARAAWGDQAKVIRAWNRCWKLDRLDSEFNQVLPANGLLPIEQRMTSGDELVVFSEEKKPLLDD